MFPGVGVVMRSNVIPVTRAVWYQPPPVAGAAAWCPARAWEDPRGVDVSAGCRAGVRAPALTPARGTVDGLPLSDRFASNRSTRGRNPLCGRWPMDDPSLPSWVGQQFTPSAAKADVHRVAGGGPLP